MKGLRSSRHKVKISVNNSFEFLGELVRYSAPRTVEQILQLLPIEGRAVLWQGGFYLQIPLKVGREKHKRTVIAGTIAYWPLGNALGFFYEDTRPYSSVNVVGTVGAQYVEILRQIGRGTLIRVEAIT